MDDDAIVPAPTSPVTVVDPDRVSILDLDLDDFLQTNSNQTQNNSAKAVLTKADRIVITGILVDDSGSMEDKVQGVVDGLNLGVEAFKGAKGSDFYLYVRGFIGDYFKGLLSEVEEDSFEGYDPVFRSTPLVGSSIDFLRKLREIANGYRQRGIPTTVALLIITDGEPYYDSRNPEDFAEMVENGEYIVGMGIVNRESGSDTAGAQYRSLFKEMGITHIMTPTSEQSAVRHAINEFSQSVASIAA